MSRRKEYTYQPKKELSPKIRTAIIIILGSISLALIYAILK
jgi:hypothetical protein